MPPMNELVALHNMISQAGDLHQPVQLEKQLRSQSGIESDVGESLLELLKVKLN